MKRHTTSRPRRFPAARRLLLLGASAAAIFFATAVSTDVPVQAAAPQPARPANLAVFQRGEELVYEVRYLTFMLGTITARCLAVDSVTKHYKMECIIRSAKGVPFVTLLTRFQSTVNEQVTSTSFSTKEHVEDTLNKYINYTFPKNRDVVYISERIGRDPIPEHYDTLTLDGKRWQDGLSLLFYARAHALQRYTDYVPVLMYRSKATTTINFGVKDDDMEIDAVPYPIHTVKLDGETGFTGIFGLTGGFEGWFSKDAASVPIYAKMHVILGSVRLELVSWKKPGWIPPRYGKN